MQSSHTGNINLPHLPSSATQAHIFPTLTSGALLSVGTLCDNNCKAVFTKEAVHISHHEIPIIDGPRDHTTGLWYVDLAPSTQTKTQPLMATPHMANNAYQTSTLSELVQFLHATCFSPSTSTFIDAIQAGYLITWPGLTAAMVSKHLPKSLATAKGHMDQQRKNTRSTQIKLEHDSHNVADNQPPTEDLGTTTHVAFVSLIDTAAETGKMYTDITGRFPVQSNRGYKYIFVLYDYDSNAILVEPIKS
jgi:hypothetical protein